MVSNPKIHLHHPNGIIISVVTSRPIVAEYKDRVEGNGEFLVMKFFLSGDLIFLYPDSIRGVHQVFVVVRVDHRPEMA